MNYASTNRGVTLIELLVTVAVLGIIAGMALPAYRGYITTTRNTEGFNDLASIQLAQEEFFLENNRYFPEPDGVVSSSDGTLDTYWTAAKDNDRNFDYAVSASAGGYTATATGRGGSYDVADTVTLPPVSN